MAMSLYFTLKGGTVWWHTALYCGYRLSVGPVWRSLQTGSKRREEPQHWHEARPSFCFIKYETSMVKQPVLTEEIVLKEPQIHTQNSPVSFFWVYFLLKSRGCPTSCNKRMTCDSPRQPPSLARCWSHPPLTHRPIVGPVGCNRSSSPLPCLLQPCDSWAHTPVTMTACPFTEEFPQNMQAGTREPNGHARTFSTTSTRLWSSDWKAETSPRRHFDCFYYKNNVPAQDKKGTGCKNRHTVS